MELIEKLGIDWRLLVAQIINFLILLFVLTKFAFKPLIKTLDERARKIEQSLADAEATKKNFDEATKQKEKVILEARHEAQDVISQTKKESEDLRQKLEAETQNEIAKMLENGREQLKREKEAMKKDLQKEMSELVVEATRKVLVGTMDEKVDREYVNKILRH